MDLKVSTGMNFSVIHTSKTGFVESFDRTPLFYRHYALENPKATVLIIHGFGEHSGRYSHVIDQLQREKFEVFSIDLRGHGYSKGSRGDIVRFRNYEDDAETAVKFAQATQKHQGKFFILAHSMGALVALSLMARTSIKIDGLVLSSPLFALSLPVPWYKKHFGTVASCLMPKLPLKSQIEGCHLSSDARFASAYDNDPLILKSLSIRAFKQILRKLETTKNLATNMKSPFLMQVAGRDMVVDSNAALAWFKSVKGLAPDRTLKIYPSLLHEIYNESLRDEPINDAINWLNQRV